MVALIFPGRGLLVCHCVGRPASRGIGSAMDTPMISLVVDLEVRPRQGPTRRRQIHTRGATAAMLASEGEYFHALRDARQKLSIFTLREISGAL